MAAASFSFPDAGRGHWVAFDDDAAFGELLDPQDTMLVTVELEPGAGDEKEEEEEEGGRRDQNSSLSSMNRQGGEQPGWKMRVRAPSLASSTTSSTASKRSAIFREQLERCRRILSILRRFLARTVELVVFHLKDDELEEDDDGGGHDHDQDGGGDDFEDADVGDEDDDNNDNNDNSGDSGDKTMRNSRHGDVGRRDLLWDNNGNQQLRVKSKSRRAKAGKQSTQGGDDDGFGVVDMEGVRDGAAGKSGDGDHDLGIDSAITIHSDSSRPHHSDLEHSHREQNQSRPRVPHPQQDRQQRPRSARHVSKAKRGKKPMDAGSSRAPLNSHPDDERNNSRRHETAGRWSIDLVMHGELPENDEISSAEEELETRLLASESHLGKQEGSLGSLRNRKKPASGSTPAIHGVSSSHISDKPPEVHGDEDGSNNTNTNNGNRNGGIAEISNDEVNGKDLLVKKKSLAGNIRRQIRKLSRSGTEGFLGMLRKDRSMSVDHTANLHGSQPLTANRSNRNFDDGEDHEDDDATTSVIGSGDKSGSGSIHIKRHGSLSSSLAGSLSRLAIRRSHAYTVAAAEKQQENAEDEEDEEEKDQEDDKDAAVGAERLKEKKKQSRRLSWGNLTKKHERMSGTHTTKTQSAHEASQVEGHERPHSMHPHHHKHPNHHIHHNHHNNHPHHHQDHHRHHHQDHHRHHRQDRHENHPQQEEQKADAVNQIVQREDMLPLFFKQPDGGGLVINPALFANRHAGSRGGAKVSSSPSSLSPTKAAMEDRGNGNSNSKSNGIDMQSLGLTIEDMREVEELISRGVDFRAGRRQMTGRRNITPSVHLSASSPSSFSPSSSSAADAFAEESNRIKHGGAETAPLISCGGDRQDNVGERFEGSGNSTTTTTTTNNNDSNIKNDFDRNAGLDTQALAASAAKMTLSTATPSKITFDTSPAAWMTQVADEEPAFVDDHDAHADELHVSGSSGNSSSSDKGRSSSLRRLTSTSNKRVYQKLTS